MLLNIELSSFLLVLTAWDEHGLVGSIDLKCDCHLFADFIYEILLILQLLVLLVRILLVDQMIQYLARVRHIEAFPIFELHLHFFWEALRQQHPYPIGVQL